MAQVPATSPSPDGPSPPSSPSFVSRLTASIEAAPCFRVPLMWGIACGIAAGLHKFRVHRASPRRLHLSKGSDLVACEGLCAWGVPMFAVLRRLSCVTHPHIPSPLVSCDDCA